MLKTIIGKLKNKTKNKKQTLKPFKLQGFFFFPFLSNFPIIFFPIFISPLLLQPLSLLYLFISPQPSTLISFFLFPFIFLYFCLFLFTPSYYKFVTISSILCIVFPHKEKKKKFPLSIPLSLSLSLSLNFLVDFYFFYFSHISTLG